MVVPVRITKSLAAADDNIIAEAQTLAAAGDVDLNGDAVNAAGFAVLDTQRRVIITSAADDTGVVFTIYGTRNGVPLVENVAGTNASIAASLLDYDTVTRVAASAATAGDIEVGTSDVGATPWFNVDYHLAPISLGIAVVVTGTVNYTVQYTYSDLTALPVQPGGATPIPVPFDDPVLAADTATGDTNFSAPVTGWRVVVNSGDGSLSITGIQAGLGGI